MTHRKHYILSSLVTAIATIVVSGCNLNEKPVAAGEPIDRLLATDREAEHTGSSDSSMKPDSEESEQIPLSNQCQQVLESALACELAKEATLANNLANATTVAFKRREVVLEEAPVSVKTPPGILNEAGHSAPLGRLGGCGCRVAGTRFDFRAGPIRQTGRSLDVAIEGDGFFQVTTADGEVRFTRDGRFALNANGMIVLARSQQGCLLEPPINIPLEATGVSISDDGSVRATLPGQAEMSDVGQIQLARFVNPEGLLPIGGNLFALSDGSGTPDCGAPGEIGLGTLRCEVLEHSNVDVPTELRRLASCRRRIKLLRRLMDHD